MSLNSKDLFNARVFIIATSLFSMSLLMANILSVKVISILGTEIDGGFLFFPITYIINDVITEVYGQKTTRFIIFNGLAISILAALGIIFVSDMPASPNWHYQSEFSTVFSFSLRLFSASLIAFVIGEMLNAHILEKLKDQLRGRYMRTRFLFSTLVGAGIENMIFYLVAFHGIMPFESIQWMAATQLLLKLCYELIAIQFTYKLSIFLIKRSQQ